jgi:hypothetical protein
MKYNKIDENYIFAFDNRIKFCKELQKKIKHHSFSIVANELQLILNNSQYKAFCQYLTKDEVINIYHYVLSKNLTTKTLK